MIDNLSMCMLVGPNEWKNAAGGVENSISESLNHVYQVILIYSGTRNDPTYQVLNDLNKQHSNIMLYEQEFNGFASQRNYGISKVDSELVFMKDSDELLGKDGWYELENFIQMFGTNFYSFRFTNVFLDCMEPTIHSHNPRIFPVNEHIQYRREGGEYLVNSEEPIRIEDTFMLPIKIFHHKLDKQAQEIRIKEYLQMRDYPVSMLNMIIGSRH